MPPRYSCHFDCSSLEHLHQLPRFVKASTWRLKNRFSTTAALFLSSILIAGAQTADSEIPEGERIETITNDTTEISLQGAEEIAQSSLEEAKPEKGDLLWRVALGARYDDNIFQAETLTEDDFIFLAKIGVEAGTRESGKGSLLARYEATGFTYLDFTDLNGVNHDASLNADLELAKTHLNFGIRFSHLDSSNPSLYRQTGDNVLDGNSQKIRSSAESEGVQNSKSNVISANASATRNLATKTVLRSSLDYEATFYDDEGLQNTNDINGRLDLGYRVTGKTTLGVAGRVGYLDAESSPKQTYQEALGTVNYEATGKLKFRGDVGVQFRQTDGDGDNKTNLAFNLAGIYQMRERTSLTLASGRFTEGSATVADSTIERTNFRISLDQKIAERFKAQITGAYELAKTTGNGIGNNIVNRDQNYWFTRVGLNFYPSVLSSIELFYQHNNSQTDGTDGLTYEANQLGIQFALSF